MTEPEGDDGRVDPGLQQRHCAAMTQHVGMKLLRPNRGTYPCGGGRVQADEAFHRVGAEPSPGAGRKQRLVASTATLGEPDPEHRLGSRGQRNSAVFSTLAQTSDAGPISENDVVAIESGQLRHTEPGLGRQQQQSAVSAAFPATDVGCVDKSVDLGRGEKRDELLVEPFGRTAKTRWITSACSG